MSSAKIGGLRGKYNEGQKKEYVDLCERIPRETLGSPLPCAA